LRTKSFQQATSFFINDTSTTTILVWQGYLIDIDIGHFFNLGHKFWSHQNQGSPIEQERKIMVHVVGPDLRYSYAIPLFHEL
jgi:hypothetical protein